MKIFFYFCINNKYIMKEQIKFLELRVDAMDLEIKRLKKITKVFYSANLEAIKTNPNQVNLLDLIKETTK